MTMLLSIARIRNVYKYVYAREAIPLVSSQFSIMRMNNKRCRYIGDDVSAALFFDRERPGKQACVGTLLPVNCHQSIS